MPKGSTALDFAFHLHTDFGNNFIKAIDARTKRALGKSYELKHRDALEIVTKWADRHTLCKTPRKMIIKVKVHPNSSQKKIKKLSKDSYEVWLREKPIENKANIDLERFLKKYFNKSLKILKGLKSKNKIIELKWNMNMHLISRE